MQYKYKVYVLYNTMYIFTIRKHRHFFLNSNFSLEDCSERSGSCSKHLQWSHKFLFLSWISTVRNPLCLFYKPRHSLLTIGNKRKNCKFKPGSK